MQHQIQQQLAALHITVPPALPATISADALATLVAHADLPDDDILYARLLQLAFPLVLADGDAELLQQCYQPLVSGISPPDSSPLRPRTSSHCSQNSQRDSRRGHIVYQGGRQMYVSKRGVHQSGPARPGFLLRRPDVYFCLSGPGRKDRIRAVRAGPHFRWLLRGSLKKVFRSSSES